MRTALRYGAVLIGTYLLVANATGAGKLITAAGQQGGGLIKRLQGR